MTPLFLHLMRVPKVCLPLFSNATIFRLISNVIVFKFNSVKNFKNFNNCVTLIYITQPRSPRSCLKILLAFSRTLVFVKQD
ncbi:hypothetical protein [Choristoneura rosaceana nucleopolyhedrovirus]|uniref:Uncharacterized protein n=1 Tax=Choristoneura rosaceana nucleopolyhedrovirus TaxID=58094 RepID=S5MRA3_9ABAC|nr:hypothetical protein [Choristoneura rosaceana nucleopolyhedrovirus]AGR57104.1 hypothetical protein [Choristoneura rosaceana nucleopolyhedrovirus]